MSSVAPPPKFSLDSTYGCLLIAVVVAAFLHGVTCVQGWCYFMQQGDAWPLKTAVAAVLVFDTIHQGLITHATYEYLITHWGDVAFLAHLESTVLIEILFNALTALIVQSFLTKRVYILSNQNLWLTAFPALLVLAEFVAITTYYGFVRYYTSFAELATVRTLSNTVNVLAAAADIVITITLCILLHKSRTGFERSDSIINKLIIFAVNTGALTSLCALGSLISMVAAPNTFAYSAFFLCIGRLYANSFLATLNARSMIRNALNKPVNDSNASQGSSKERGQGIITPMRFRLTGFFGDGTRDQHNISAKIDKTSAENSIEGKEDDVLELRPVSV